MHDYTTQSECEGKLEDSSWTDCFPTEDGQFSRFACMDGEEGKVFTDICTDATCNEQSCMSEWTWRTEYASTCYFDGTAYYGYECTNLDLDEEYVPPETAPVLSAKICAELGEDWVVPPQSSYPNVCAATKVNGDCPPDTMTQSEANTFCEDFGARLCTADELEGDVAKGTGCKNDLKYVWTSSECEGGFVKTAGAIKSAMNMPATCVPETDTSATVRCCADISNDGGVAPNFPPGYRMAIAYDFPSEQSTCGGEPLRTYSCWTNTATGVSQRLACNVEENVWVQSCGSDASCAASSCKGAWYTFGEMPGKCYTEDDVLYTYVCS